MPNHKRMPVLLWGDLREGASPVLRRALAGYRAHECMYAWVYLTEHLAHRRLLALLPELDQAARRALFTSLDGQFWKDHDRKVVDPHFQISRDAFEQVAYLACLAAGQTEPAFIELGSTFFTARTKFETVNAVARELFADWPRFEPRWVGIDNSPFMHDTAQLLHGQAMRLVDDYRKADREGAIFISRFVSSYVFQSGREFADYLSPFRAALIEDAYSTTSADVPVENHGQPEVFFSVPEAMGQLERAGFEIYLLDHYPDFPAGAAPCHVIRYLAAKPGVYGLGVAGRLSALGFNAAQRVAGLSLLDRLNSSVSASQWDEVERAKQASPVWGRAQPRASARTRLARWLRSFGKWGDYRLRSPLAAQEIQRALGEEMAPK